jgi:hypothetical protein
MPPCRAADFSISRRRRHYAAADAAMPLMADAICHSISHTLMPLRFADA